MVWVGIVLLLRVPPVKFVLFWFGVRRWFASAASGGALCKIKSLLILFCFGLCGRVAWVFSALAGTSA